MKNKVNHIFDKAAHNLDLLLTKFGGPKNTFRAVLNKLNGKLPVNGLFKDISIDLEGYNVEVSGMVVGGITKIGTMFIP
ncbi:hypothetical protein SAMN04488122_6800 [Chitinophaga arvensicola]|uniref:Uncharacterized protein n=2 Tax=Chitinophaga arvensicola TaxID=29529 RepID=A0A1I0SEE7_9BACT|nr:hypothetical protein SAMN04488122_6800 [Chitinophaga arvensicola]